MCVCVPPAMDTHAWSVRVPPVIQQAAQDVSSSLLDTYGAGLQQVGNSPTSAGPTNAPHSLHVLLQCAGLGNNEKLLKEDVKEGTTIFNIVLWQRAFHLQRVGRR